MPQNAMISRKREWKKRVFFKIPKKGTRFVCDHCRGICVVHAIVKIIAEIILERVKELDRQRKVFAPGPPALTTP